VAFAQAAYTEKLRGTIQNQVEADRVAHDTLATARAASAGTGRFAAAASGAGSSAANLKGKFDDLSGKPQGMLDKVPGLGSPSSVTDEQLKLASLGVPQNFADDYLRQLTDEVMNGVDWAGVDIKDAASRAGIDPNLPAEAILEMFKNAWANKSLFANPANLDLINMDAVKADLLKQQQQATGSANLMALFGIGDDGTVAGVAALGLSVQQGLADWLSQNGFGEQGAAIAASLGAGVGSTDAVGVGAGPERGGIRPSPDGTAPARSNPCPARSPGVWPAPRIGRVGGRGAFPPRFGVVLSTFRRFGWCRKGCCVFPADPPGPR
jgi:hypothetical protein